jgi:4a-hydroxytetrahydrobiopterin dehydratase
MTDLKEKHCVPCEGGVKPLTRDEALALAKKLDTEWEVSADGKWLRKDFKFKGFHKTMGFVNALAWVANLENHHPDLEVGYGHCKVNLQTHAIDGLSENDFICAAKFDALVRDLR